MLRQTWITHAVLQNPTPTRRAKLSMQQRPAPVISDVLFCIAGCYLEGGFGDLGREAEGAAEEFLDVRDVCLACVSFLC
jgi:hypothetical protein